MLLDVSEALIPADSPVSFLPGDEGQFGSQAEMRVRRKNFHSEENVLF